MRLLKDFISYSLFIVFHYEKLQWENFESYTWISFLPLKRPKSICENGTINDPNNIPNQEQAHILDTGMEGEMLGIKMKMIYTH